MSVVALKDYKLKQTQFLSANGTNEVTVSATLPTLQFNYQIKSVPDSAPMTSDERATKANLDVVPARVTIVKWILEQELRTGKRKPAIEYLLSLNKTGRLSRRLASNLAQTNKSGKIPSRSTLYTWVSSYLESGRKETALQDNHTGRRRMPQEWDLRALQMYHLPSKPGYHDVAFWLQDEGYQVTGAQVRRFILTMPATYGPQSKWRVGKHFYNLNKGAYVTRDRSSLDVGEMYEGDGHTCDVYVQHASGVERPYRIELTAWMDIRTRKIVGWFPSHAESSLTTLYSLSSALIQHDHVPHFVHIDKGSGFKAKLLSDESVGFYEKMSITPHEAIAGNAKGKGDIEGWFRIFRDKHDKKFGVDYCGHDQAAETNRRITPQMSSKKRAKRQLVTLEEYLRSVQQFIDRYNNTPQKALGNKSPDELWATLKRNPVILSDVAAIRPSDTRVVRRSQIKIHERLYQHPALLQYDGAALEIEYDTRDDSKVWIYDDKHRLVCIAPLKAKQDWIPADRREEANQKAIKGRQKRREKQMELDRMEASLVSDDNNHQYQTLHVLENELPDDDEPDQPLIEIDLHDFD